MSKTPFSDALLKNPGIVRRFDEMRRRDAKDAAFLAEIVANPGIVQRAKNDAFCKQTVGEFLMANQPAVPGSSPRREPVAPWVRFEVAGKAPWEDGDLWYCTTDAHGAFGDEEENLSSDRPLAVYGWDDSSDDDRDDGACESCAERAGVFGPVGANGEHGRTAARAAVVAYAKQAAAGEFYGPGIAYALFPQPVVTSTPTSEPAGAWDIPSSAPPIPPACSGPLATHGMPVLRVVKDQPYQNNPTRELLCDGCYLRIEQDAEELSQQDDICRADDRPPVRVGTVPQFLGPMRGIWASRGMR